MWRRAAAALYASSRGSRGNGRGRRRDLWTGSTRSASIETSSTASTSSSFRPPPATPLFLLRSRSIGGVPEGAQVFDRDLKRAHRDRSAWLRRGKGDDPLVAEVASRLVDRLADCSPRVAGRFRRALLLGAEPSVIDSLAAASSPSSSAPPFALEEVEVVDSSAEKLRLLSERFSLGSEGREPNQKLPFRVTLVREDEETFTPPESAFDVVLSCGGLHWVNDLPGLLSRCRRSLRASGVFVAAVPGGDSLHELRRALAKAEMSEFGGVSARVSPMIRMRDAGSLLGRAGFVVPGVDVDEIVVRYDDASEAIDHLRCLGESNAVRRRDARPMRRGVARAAVREYERICAEEDEREGGGGGGGGGGGVGGGGGGGVGGNEKSGVGKTPVRSTFEVFYLTGWAPPEAGKEGPKAAERGSATVSFADLAEAVARKKKESEGEK